jgi:hypothetical protein
MSPDASPKPSFSPARRWSIGLNVALLVLAVLALAAMVNYLSGHYSRRFYLGTRGQVELSSRTIHLLHSLTNRIRITLYYDRDEPLYGDIAGLLKEYQANNPRIFVATVDYYRDPGAVQEFKEKYNLGSSTNKNLVIFDCEGRIKIVDGNALAQYTLEPVPNATQREFRRKLVAFKGEMMFTGALLTVINPKPLQAGFLQGHGEHRLDDSTEAGYAKFGAVLQQNCIQVTPLTLLGTNTVPPDCNLLIIAGPTDPIPSLELDRIGQYLDEGGRLLVLFNVNSVSRPTGLEQLVARWGIRVGASVVKDPDNTVSGSDVVVMNFANHPVVNPLIGRRLQLFLPRAISTAEPASQVAEALKAEEIAFSGPRSFAQPGGAAGPLQAFPLAVAVERDAAKGLVPQRGSPRILAVGDSLFLDNQVIDFVDPNRDFAAYAANWLLDRGVLLQGIGPRRVTEYRLDMTRRQIQTVQWILLGALPGGVLLLGGLVWLGRRR